MKKLLITLLIILSWPALAQAATLFSQNSSSFYMNESKDIWPITVTADADNEITAKDGINIFFDADGRKMLWDISPTLTAAGTAVTGGKIAATIKPVYQNDYKVLHIPVLADFAAGEAVTLSGFRLRAYNNAFTQMFLQLDINGDLQSDAQDLNKIEVQNVAAADHTPPYPPKSFTATLSSDLKQVTLNWIRGPDYDLLGVNLDRVRVRKGNSQNISLMQNRSDTTYIDNDFLPGDAVTYNLYDSDGANNSEPLVQTIKISSSSTPTNPVIPTPPDTQTETDTETPAVDAQKAELDQLTKLYSYFKVRYGIKCRLGEATSNSACLWSKIDVVYAQALLGKADINTSLTTRDLEVIGQRIVYPEARYQEKCVGVQIPDKTCPALEKSLKRAHYFLDRK